MNLDQYKAMKQEFITDPDNREGRPMMSGYRGGVEVVVVEIHNGGSMAVTTMAGYLASAFKCDMIEHCMDAYLVTTPADSDTIPQLLAGGATLEQRFKEGHPAVSEALVYSQADLVKDAYAQQGVGYHVNDEDEVIWEPMRHETEIGLAEDLLDAMKRGNQIPVPPPIQVVIEAMKEDNLDEHDQRIVIDAMAFAGIPSDMYSAAYLGASEEDMVKFTQAYRSVTGEDLAVGEVCPGCENCQPKEASGA